MRATPQPSRRSSPFVFLSGRLCLDFVHTGGEDARGDFEAWHTPDDLAAWLGVIRRQQRMWAS
jgi:hypothetical protein